MDVAVELQQIVYRNKMRDQSEEVDRNIRFAATLNLPRVKVATTPSPGKFVIVAGGPSVKDHLEQIRALRSEPHNVIFAINWAHNWLISNEIVPDGCLMYEIDVDPTGVLEKPHPDVTYYICSLCHPTTFKALEGYKCLLWHAQVDPKATHKALLDCFPREPMIGGGFTTCSRTVPMGMALGYSNFDIYGADSSFPAGAAFTHLDDYPTNTRVEDAIQLWTVDEAGEKRCFNTLPYLAIQAEMFYDFLSRYHELFRLRFHGEGLLPFIHKADFPEQYE